MPQIVGKVNPNSQLLDNQSPNTMTYVAPPGSNSQIKNSEIEEENKESAGTNEELFKHLSYLSQLSNDVSKH